MPNLSEFLGAIIQEAAKARMLADLETIKIAEYYYQDRYLKNIPIPHFKMPDLTIEMPVEIEQIDVNNIKSNSEILNSLKIMLSADLKKYVTNLLASLKSGSTLAGKQITRTLESRRLLSKNKGTEKLLTIDKEIEELAKDVSDKVLNICFVSKDNDYLDANKTPIKLTIIYDAINVLLEKEFNENTRCKSYFKDDREQIKKALDGAKEVFYNSATEFLKKNDTVLNIVSRTDEIIKYTDTKHLTFLKLTLKEQDYEWAIGGDKDNDCVEDRNLVIE